MHRALSILILLAVALPANAIPLPPAQRAAKAPGSKEAVKVKVRRIEQIKPISTTAPPPRSALVGKHRLVVVLVQTEDSKFNGTNLVEHTREHFFATDRPSLAHFYRENSYGLYEIEGDVLGPYDVPGKLADYSYGQGAGPERIARFIEAALAAAAADIDEKRFDTHDRFGRAKPDNVIDHFGVVFPANQPGSDGYFAPIWPHRGDIDAKAAGRRIKSYFVFADTLPLGAAVHEFGHDIGLPDLYDRDDSSHGAGAWCTMAAGSWLGDGNLPSHIAAWGKVKMGWVRPRLVARSQTRVEIPAVETSPVVLKVPVGKADAPEYFLIENRQPLGYDAKLPDAGLLIWHIDESVKNNDEEGHKLVDVEEPSKTQDLDRMVSDREPDHIDTYRAGRRTRFADDTNPSALSNAGKPTGILIDNISPSKGVMTADFVVPTIRVPDGEPFEVVQDNYSFGAFGFVPLPKGSEELIEFRATPGGYDLTRIEALVVSKPNTTGMLTVRVYTNAGGKPGKPLLEKTVKARFGSDSYTWLKVPLGNDNLRLKSKQKFWLGVRHESKQIGLAFNPDSNSKKSHFRFGANKPVQDGFPLASGTSPVPDYIVRLGGYGFIGMSKPKLPEQADENDALIQRMREADALLDKKDFLGAKAQYETILPKMEEDASRFATWIPVVHNALGVAAYQAKDYPAAVDYFERSLRKAQLAGDVRAEADILENIGETHFFAGDLQVAAGYCARSEKLNGDRPDRLLENTYWLGRIAHARGNASDAAAHFARAAALLAGAHASDDVLRARWRARLERARAGTAVGEDWGDGQSRLERERAEERALEEADDIEETSGDGRQVDFADFGISITEEDSE